MTKRKIKQPKKETLLKVIKKAIGRLSCPPTKVVPNKKSKILSKLKKKEVEDET